MFFREVAKRGCIVIPSVDAHDPSDLMDEGTVKEALSIVKGLKLNIVDDYDLVAEADRRKKQLGFL